MAQTLTDDERKVIDILIQHPVTANAREAPVYAVDKVMNWYTEKTTAFVDDLTKRGLIHIVHVGRSGTVYNAQSYWKEGKSDAV